MSRWPIKGRILLIAVVACLRVTSFNPAALSQCPSHHRRITSLKESLTKNDDSLASGKALVGMGCFWKPQESFLEAPGVVRATVGYANTTAMENERKPSYLSVCAGSGYTEAVLVEFNASQTTYRDVLGVFWQNHDASLRNKDQYRSVVWPLSVLQQEIALEDVDKANKAYEEQGMDRVQTTVTKIASEESSFTPAESIHDRYWPKTFTKVMIYAIATAIGMDQTHDPSLDIAIKPLLGLVGAWLIWEVVELSLSGFTSTRARSNQS